uniref:Mucin-1 n=1 Tax=Spermophilus dauricus TaxID=99837 RepID=A0A8C9QHZ5_SPEDA
MTPGIQSPFFLLLLLPVTVPPSTSSNHSSPSPVYVRVSFFSLSFYISNLKFNSSLENPRTNYYQELQRNISELSGSGVPGWGIALLVLVCVLLALAILYLIALVSTQSLAFTGIPW